MKHPARRHAQLLRLLKDEDLPAMLVTHPVNVTYLTGFSGDSSYLVLGRSKTLLISDGRYTQQIEEECPGLATHIRPPDRHLHQATTEVLNQLGFRQLGFESNHLSVAGFDQLRELTPTIDWKPGTDRVERLRMVKDESEIEQIREAIAIAERAYAMFRAMLRPGETEKELADALDGYMRRAGASEASFPPIVAVGDRAALPHAPPTSRRVEESDLVLVDWGACGGLYKSDLTRLLVRRKMPPLSKPRRRMGMDAKLAKVYTVVQQAQEAAIRAVRPGVATRDVDAAARAVIAEAGYGPYFNHGLGHGLGLQVHEGPAVRANSNDVFQPGMVVTIEPGIYLPGWGGMRIEDDILVTPDGAEVLSHLPRDYESALLDW